MATRRVPRLLAFVSLSVCVLGIALTAASPTFWTVTSQADFLKGDVEDLSIDADGRMFLGPAASVLGETSAPFLWSIVAGPDGSLLAGSGNEGKVLKVARDGKVTTFFDATELEVHAIAPAPQGGLYVATSPDGKIYSVAADGSSKTLFDPEDKYIWALASDPSGTLYAATGDKGVIYKITPDGKGARFYKTSATNVVALAVTKNGDLIAGTESPGRIFRIDSTGKAFVLLDSPYREIHALRIAADGSIYAAAVSATPSSGASDRPSESLPADAGRSVVPSVSSEITGMTVVESGITSGSTTPSAPRSPRRPGRGAIYRIRPDGFWDTIWETAEDAPYDIVVEDGGSLLVGTGTEGKIFRLTGNPAKATLLARAAARQVTALLREPSGRIVGATSNPGKVFALSSSPAKKGTYESDVRDAGTVASWGAIRWRSSGRGQVQIVTRSGNTATPDETWSAWSKVYSNADGEPISSPNARYLQWKATISSDTSEGPVLTSVTAAYLPRNLRPEVASITVHPPGAVFQRPFSTGEMEIAGFEDNTSDGRPQNQPSAASSSTPAPPTPSLGRRIYQKGLQTFVWKADDQNDDRLQYDVSYRREGETSWKLLKRGLWDPITVWDTTSVPDGTYVLKIAASDAPSNSPATALIGELESTSFEIDNTPPRIDLQTPAARAGNRSVAFTVRDEQSSVQRVEYSLDASRWRTVYPKDGIADSRREEFEIALEEGELGRSVLIRATDAMNNVATAVTDARR